MVLVSPLPLSSISTYSPSIDTFDSNPLDYYLDELANTFQRAQYLSDASATHLAEFAESLFRGVLSEKEGLLKLFQKTRFLNLLVEAADPYSYHPLFHTSLVIILLSCQRIQKSLFPPNTSSVRNSLGSYASGHAAENSFAFSSHSDIEFSLTKLSESLSFVLTRKDCFHLALNGLYLLHLSDKYFLPFSEKVNENLINALNFWNPQRKNSSSVLTRLTSEVVSENGSAMAGLDERVAYEQLVLFIISISCKNSKLFIPCLSALFLSPSLFVEVLVQQVLLGESHSDQALVHILLHFADDSVIVQVLDFFYVYQKENMTYFLPLLFWQWLLSFGVDNPDPVISSIATQISKTALKKLPTPFDPIPFLQLCFTATEPSPDFIAELIPILLEHIQPLESRLHVGISCLHHLHEAVKTSVSKYISSQTLNISWHPLALAFQFPPEFDAFLSISPSMESLEGMQDHVEYLLTHLEETWQSSRALKSLALLSKHPCYNALFALHIDKLHKLWLDTSLQDPSTYLLQILRNCDINMPDMRIKSRLLLSLHSIHHSLKLLTMESTNTQLRFQISQLFLPPSSSPKLETSIVAFPLTPELLSIWTSNYLQRYSQTYLQPFISSKPQEHTSLLSTIHTLRLLTIPSSSAQFILSHPFQLCKYLSIVPGCPEDIECQAMIITFLASLVKWKSPNSRSLIDEVFMSSFESVIWPYLRENGATSTELAPLIQACFDYVENYPFDHRCVPFFEMCIKVQLWIQPTLRCLLNKPEIQAPWLTTEAIRILRQERKPSVLARHAIVVLLSQNTDEGMIRTWLVNDQLHWLIECLDQGHNLWRLLAKLLSGATRHRLMLMYSELHGRCLQALPMDSEAWFYFLHLLVLRKIENLDHFQIWWRSGLSWLQRPYTFVHELIMRSWMHVAYDDPGWILMQQECYPTLKYFFTHAKDQAVLSLLCSLLARYSTTWMSQLESDIVSFIQSVVNPSYALLDFVIQFVLCISKSDGWLVGACTSWLPFFATKLQNEDSTYSVLIFQILALSLQQGMTLNDSSWINLIIPFLPRYPDHVAYLLLPLSRNADSSAMTQAIFSNINIRMNSSILTLLCSTNAPLKHPKIHAYLLANLVDIPIMIYKALIKNSKDLTYWIDSIDLLNKLLLACYSTPSPHIFEVLIYFASFSSGRLYYSQKKVAGQILKFIDKKLAKYRDAKLYLRLIEGFSRHPDLHTSILYDIDILLDLTPHLFSSLTIWITLRNLCFSNYGRIKLASWIQHTLVRGLFDVSSQSCLYCILEILWVYSYHEYGTSFRSYLGDKLILLRQRYGDYSISFENVEEEILKDNQLNRVESKDIVFLLEIILKTIDKSIS